MSECVHENLVYLGCGEWECMTCHEEFDVDGWNQWQLDQKDRRIDMMEGLLDVCRKRIADDAVLIEDLEATIEELRETLRERAETLTFIDTRYQRRIAELEGWGDD
jgi:hypothetical protein